MDAIELPFAADGYNYDWTSGEPYLPTSYTWRHNCLINSSGQSAANSLPNGNLYVNVSHGYMYEVDQDDNTVWQYNAGPPKGFRYTCDDPGVEALISQGVIENTCAISNTFDVEKARQIQIAPNPSSGLFSITGLMTDDQVQKIELTNLLGAKKELPENSAAVDLSMYPDGVYFLTIQFNNNQFITKKIIKN